LHRRVSHVALFGERRSKENREVEGKKWSKKEMGFSFSNLSHADASAVSSEINTVIIRGDSN
jgi:hypothetical protein